MPKKQNKIQRTARILYPIFNIFYWVEIAAAAVCGLVFLASFFIPEGGFAVKGGSFGFSFDNAVYFKLDDSLTVNLKPFIQTGAPFGIAIIAILAIGTRKIADILKSVTNNKPFAEENASRLTVIAIDLIAASVVVNVARFLFASYMIHLLDINQLSANLSIDPTLLLTGFLVLILAGVFKYGNYLKKEYDATI